MKALRMTKALNPRPHSIPADFGITPKSKRDNTARDSLTHSALSAGGALSGRLARLHMTQSTKRGVYGGRRLL